MRREHEAAERGDVRRPVVVEHRHDGDAVGERRVPEARLRVDEEHPPVALRVEPLGIDERELEPRRTAAGTGAVMTRYVSRRLK